MAGRCSAFASTRWEPEVQMLEITTGELLPDQSVIPALKEPSAKRWKRKESSREEAIKIREATG